jgi:chorismate synthase
MSFNTFGQRFRFTTWGESHGKAIGAVIDGVPPLISLNEADIQVYLDKRKPGSSKFVTQRQEEDRVEILSGVFEGKTTGTPISLIIYNQDQKSKDYGDIKDKFRPGHADYTYFAKYGIRDYRGGGRSSARETAMRVASGAVARKVLDKLYPKNNIKITGALIQIGEHKIDRKNWQNKEINNNPFFSPDKKIVPVWEEYLLSLRKSGDSVGAMVELIVENMPVGLGEPIYGKLDADIASGLMGINAVKSVEIGSGIESASAKGSEVADEMFFKNKKVIFSHNNNGGTLGGISSGQNLVVRFAIKPTSSILKETNTINEKNKETTIQTKGRHDPCVGIRAVPVGEAMLACILADHALRHKSQVL